MNLAIPNPIHNLLLRIEERGYEAYIVGGACRDLVYREFMITPGPLPTDWDITTNATPDQIIDIFSDCLNVKTVDSKDFKVVVVDWQGYTGVEIATYRKDIYADCKTVGTEVVDTLEEDLARRDLTFNAMALRRDGKLIDPYNGRDDLMAGFVRFIGKDEKRIIEDPVRMVRAIRFTCIAEGFILSQNAHDAMINCNSFIARIAPERLRLEILKAMKLPYAANFFINLHRVDLLRHIFPSLDLCWGADGGQYHDETIFEHNMLCGQYDFSEQVVANADHTDHVPYVVTPIVRLALFLHDIGKTQPNLVDGVLHFYKHPQVGEELARAELAALTFTKKEVNTVAGIINVHMRGGLKMAPKTVRKLIQRLNDVGVDYRDFVAVRTADRAANLQTVPYTKGQVAKLLRKFEFELNPTATDPETSNVGARAYEHKDLAISGTRVKELLNIKPCGLVGVVLQYLLDQVIIDPTLNTPENLKRLLGKD